MTPAPTMPRRLGTSGQGEGAGIAEDQLFVEVAPGQRARARARGDDDVLGVEGLSAHRDVMPAPARPGEAAAAVEEGHLVLLEEVGDAVVVLLHHLVLALEHLREVELQALHLHAVLGEAVPGLLVVLRGLQHRLRRDAADVGAGAAERGLAIRALPLVDAGDGKPELRRADRGDVAAGAAADDHHVERLGHRRPGLRLYLEREPRRVLQRLLDRHQRTAPPRARR